MSGKPQPTTDSSEFNPVVEFAREHAQQLRLYLRRRLRRQHEAEDLAQEVYLRLMRMPRERELLNPLAYIKVIASNVLNDYILTGSQRVSERGVVWDTKDMELQGADEAAANAIEDRINLEQQLDRAIRQLPEIEQVVLLLVKRDGWSREQVAARLNISEHMVHHHLKRAKARLRSTAWDR